MTVVRWFRVFALVALAALGVVASSGAGSTLVRPRYSVVLQIVPKEAAGSAPAEGGSQLYQLRLKVDDADEPVVPDFPTLELLAGEKRSRSVDHGSLTLRCEVAVDADGRRAASLVELTDGGVPVLTQRFAVWLPELVVPEK